MQIPAALERLIEEFSRFPGVGRKTAQRLALSILRYTSEEIHNLTEALTLVKEKIHFCSVCSGFTDTDPCAICTNSGRDKKQLCVVEQPNNIFPIENSGAYKGVYHVLMGAISPLEGIGPQQLNLVKLRKRVNENQINELIKKSQQYDFDTTTRQWFQLTPVQINQLTHQQLQHWIDQAKILIRFKKG